MSQRDILQQLADAFIRGLEEDFENRKEGVLEPVARCLEQPDHPEPDLGQIWRVSPVCKEGLPALVTLTHTGEVLRCILTTSQTWMAATDDLYVPAESSPTREAMLLCTWMDQPMRHANLAGYVGQLPEEVFEPLLMVLQRNLTGGFKLRAREVTSRGDLPLVRWEICPENEDSSPRRFLSGPRILDDEDPRLQARSALRSVHGWATEEVKEEVFERGGAAEPEAWYRELARRLRAAVDGLEAHEVDPGKLAGAAASSAAIGGLIGAGIGSSVGGGMFGGLLNTLFPPLGNAATAALRGAEDEPTETVSFTLPGEVETGISVTLSEDGLYLRVAATDGDRPGGRYRVRLREGSELGRLLLDERTDRCGVLLAGPLETSPGEPLRLELGTGDDRRVLSF